MQNTIITIARVYGSGGRTIGKMLSRQLDIPYYDRNLIYLASDNSGIGVQQFSENDEKVGKDPINFDIVPSENKRYVSQNAIFEHQSRIVHNVADQSDCIIVGRCANHLLWNGRHKLLRIFIYAPNDVCVKTIMKKFSVSEYEAQKTFKQINKHRKEYYKYHTGREWESARNYDMCFDTSVYSYDRVVNAVKQYYNIFKEI